LYNRLVFTEGGGVSELATRTNLLSIVRQTHLELTEALRGTEPFCSII